MSLQEYMQEQNIENLDVISFHLEHKRLEDNLLLDVIQEAYVDYKLLKAILLQMDNRPLECWQTLLSEKSHLVTNVVRAKELPPELHEFCLFTLPDEKDADICKSIIESMLCRSDLSNELSQRWFNMSMNALNVYQGVIEQSNAINFEYILKAAEAANNKPLNSYGAVLMARFTANSNCSLENKNEILRFLNNSMDKICIHILNKININLIHNGLISNEITQYVFSKFDKLTQFWQGELIKSYTNGNTLKGYKPLIP